jgi:uncharacterized membrane protein
MCWISGPRVPKLQDDVEEVLKEQKSPERLVFFTDAVVAIALTLLVLPLTEIAAEVVVGRGESAEAVTEHQWQIYSFLLSFVVIGRQWMAHHRLFGDVTKYSTPLLMTNFVWLLTIVVLPFPTQMVGAFGTDRFTCLFYIGTVLANSLCLTVLVGIVRAHPELTGGAEEISGRWWFVSVGNSVVLMVAFALVALVPSVNYFGLLLLVVPPLVARKLRSSGRYLTAGADR